MHFSPQRLTVQSCFFCLRVCRKALTTVKRPHILDSGLIQPLVLWMTTCVLIVYLHIMKATVRVIKLHQSMC